MTSLLLNFCLLIACAFAISLTYREWPVRRRCTAHTVRLILTAGATWLLLDNMHPPVLRDAVALVAGRVPTEASGGVRLDTIRSIAETGVTYVSVGRLTQSAPAADIGLDFAAA